MDENTSQSQTPKSSGRKWIIPAVVVGLIVIAAVAFFMMSQNQPSTTSSVPSGQAQMEGEATPMPQTGQSGAGADGVQEEVADASAYKDGTYEAEGTYVTPGGSRNVEVSVTVEDGVVTAATFQGFATDPNSRRFQNEFRENFTGEVVGKNIDEIQLTKVAGSSLSPKGFMDALAKIKTEAQS